MWSVPRLWIESILSEGFVYVFKKLFIFSVMWGFNLTYFCIKLNAILFISDDGYCGTINPPSNHTSFRILCVSISFCVSVNGCSK